MSEEEEEGREGEHERWVRREVKGNIREGGGETVVR